VHGETDRLLLKNRQMFIIIYLVFIIYSDVITSLIEKIMQISFPNELYFLLFTFGIALPPLMIIGMIEKNDTIMLNRKPKSVPPLCIEVSVGFAGRI
jgi:hypothetical protein